ncbi:peptidylprolyl isomerase [Acidimangrovimonas pyrenivorans]|uniref:Parvulin-like PPIase n=1 Tax=Acidimangrovimonas pyrenivorans TaxID=2030798 RepID=A0ABV7AF54_9RHOB
MARKAKPGKAKNNRATEAEEAPRKKRKAGDVIVWIMLAMIVFGLGGYGVTNFGGGVRKIGSVGNAEISTDDYARALRQELQAMSAQTGKNITMQQARQIGLDQQVLGQLVTTAALDDEDAKLGISVGDARLRQEITGMSSFQGADGKFDPETYRFVLKQNGLTEAGFEAKIRDELARGLLQDAVVSGFAVPKPYVDTLISYIGERRGFETLKLTPADLATPVPAPTDDQLQAYYKDHPKTYTSLRAKRITYAELLPDMLAKTVKIDDKDLRALYAKKKADYVKPEKRLVERLVYPDLAKAKAAKAKLDVGEASFEQLVKARGLELSDIDMGDVTKGELGKAGDAVFAAKQDSVIGPVETDLGPALFRINGVIAAQTTTFDEARPDLLVELQTSKARDLISGQIEHLNDLLAGGATLEDLAKETDMTIGQIDYTAQTTDGIAAYSAFRKAADKVTKDDYPEIIQLDDGGVVAIRLDKVVEPALIPLAKVRDKVAADWKRDATDKALMARADEIKKAVAAGGKLTDFGTVDVQDPIERSGYVADAPQGMMAGVFKMKKGAVEAFQGAQTVWLVDLTRVLPPDETNPDLEKARTQLADQGSQGIANDAFQLFATALQRQAGIQINQAAVNAVNAQFH